MSPRPAGIKLLDKALALSDELRYAPTVSTDLLLRAHSMLSMLQPLHDTAHVSGEPAHVQLHRESARMVYHRLLHWWEQRALGHGADPGGAPPPPRGGTPRMSDTRVPQKRP
jgi:hypothetical protein